MENLGRNIDYLTHHMFSALENIWQPETSNACCILKLRNRQCFLPRYLGGHVEIVYTRPALLIADRNEKREFNVWSFLGYTAATLLFNHDSLCLIFYEGEGEGLGGDEGVPVSVSVSEEENMSESRAKKVVAKLSASSSGKLY